MSPALLRSFAAGAVLLAASPALAHASAQHTGYSFLDGMLHPVTGLDHLAAMLAVGLWAGCSSGRAMVGWPLAFLGAMALGAMIAFALIDLPGVEAVILASLLVIGGLLLAGVRTPLAVGAAIAAAFALFHGHAHGAEAPLEAFFPYMAGFLVSTAGLLAIGVGLGRLLQRQQLSLVCRLAGGAVAGLAIALMVL